MKQLFFTTILIFTFCSLLFAQTNTNNCPKISIEGTKGVFETRQIAKFKVVTGEEVEKSKIEYVWTFSGGEILQGQGTPEVKFSGRKIYENSNITVKVELIGLPDNCNNSVSDTFSVFYLIIDTIFDQFGKVPKNELFARFSNFYVSIRNSPNHKGFIVLEFNENEKRTEKIKRLNTITKYLNSKKFDKTLLSFLIGEGKTEKTKFYVARPDVELMAFVSDPENYELIKGEEIDQKIKELFPKK